jgi:hypothetical protein
MALTAVVLGTAGTADAQGRSGRRDRQDVARAQGVLPGQLPPADRCRVWYDNRPNGRQPAPTDCRRAEALAARDRNARVVYGEDVYWDARDSAVRRDGRVRDPRLSGGVMDGRRGAAAYQNGYRDGLTKGREDGEDHDRFDVNRHSWYRSAERGYDDDLGTKAEYQRRYRDGFEEGYSEGYRVYARR